jgi:hypothetical protein
MGNSDQTPPYDNWVLELYNLGYLPPQPLISLTNMLRGPTSGVQLSYGITKGACYTLDPK